MPRRHLLRPPQPPLALPRQALRVPSLGAQRVRGAMPRRHLLRPPQPPLALPRQVLRVPSLRAQRVRGAMPRPHLLRPPQPPLALPRKALRVPSLGAQRVRGAMPRPHLPRPPRPPLALPRQVLRVPRRARPSSIVLLAHWWRQVVRLPCSSRALHSTTALALSLRPQVPARSLLALRVHPKTPWTFASSSTRANVKTRS